MADTEMAAAPADEAPAIAIQQFSPELLRFYYSRLFPYRQMFEWLAYGDHVAEKTGAGAGAGPKGKGRAADPAGPGVDRPEVDFDADEDDEDAGRVYNESYFMRREFSFTIENDIYIRYLCFRSEAELRREMQKKQPHKIDIGAVYSAPPKDHTTMKQGAFKPVEREFVIDIDLDDYNEIRVETTMTGPGGLWAQGSWQFMANAVKVLDQALREDFGFKHLLWVFSGRRGVHCWVCDRRARKLTDENRKAVIEYLSIVGGGAQQNAHARVGASDPLHPVLGRAHAQLEPFFLRTIIPAVDAETGKAAQGLLASPERWGALLALVPDESLRERLAASWKKDFDRGVGKRKLPTALARWEQLKASVAAECKRLGRQSGAGMGGGGGGGGGAGDGGDGGKNAHFEALNRMRTCLTTIVLFFTYPRLDVNVSTHRNHLLKSPFVAHPKTGKVCVPLLDPQNADRFDPDRVPTLAALEKEINAYDEAHGKGGGDAMDDGEGGGGDGAPAAKRRKGVAHYEKTSLKDYIDGFDEKFLKAMKRERQARHAQSVRAKSEQAGEW